MSLIIKAFASPCIPNRAIIKGVDNIRSNLFSKLASKRRFLMGNRNTFQRMATRFMEKNSTKSISKNNRPFSAWPIGSRKKLNRKFRLFFTDSREIRLLLKLKSFPFGRSIISSFKLFSIGSYGNNSKPTDRLMLLAEKAIGIVDFNISIHVC